MSHIDGCEISSAARESGVYCRGTGAGWGHPEQLDWGVGVLARKVGGEQAKWLGIALGVRVDTCLTPPP